MLTTRQVKAYARQAGADLVGVASPERFADVPAERNPLTIFPHAKAIIMVGRRITRGTLRGVEEGTNFNTYSCFGYQWLDADFISLMTFNVVSYLEDQGWEATPLFPYPPQAYPQGIVVREGSPAPNVYPDFDHAAVAAGLGEIGYCGVFLSPQFGPRQRFQMIITDAPLTADPLLTESICGYCGQCVAACPLGALDSSREEVVKVAGKSMTVCAVDYEKCRLCHNGAQLNRYHPSGLPDRVAAVCMRTCLQVLEESDKLTSRFVNPFRTRPPWSLDAWGQPSEVPEAPVKARDCGDPVGERARKGEA
jgi:epoxyqueuosine reductase